MKIILKELRLINFKGIKDMTFEFSDTVTNIHGANGTGKTTIADAYRWLLTGKDSSDRKDFEVKPTDKHGDIIQKLENEVSGILVIDEEYISLRRINREKWSKIKGSAQEEFKGNETIYFINDVPCNQKEYQTKIFSFIDDNILKYLTDTIYFNGVMSWQERRKTLTQIAGNITDAQVLEAFNKYHPEQGKFIKELLAAKKSFEERKSELSNKKKLDKEEKDLIPSRIDEVKRGMPVTMPFERIRTNLAKLEEEQRNIDAQIADTRKADADQQLLLKGKRQTLQEIDNELAKIESDYKLAYNEDLRKAGSRLTELQSKLKEAKAGKDSATRVVEALLQRMANGSKKITDSEAAIEKLKTHKVTLGEQWTAKNHEQFSFDPYSCTCPTCKQSLPQADIEKQEEELRSNFNFNKQNILNSLVDQVKKVNEDIKAEEASIESFKKILTDLQVEGDLMAQAVTTANEEIGSLEAEIAIAENTEIPEPEKVIDRCAKDEGYQDLCTQRDQLSNELSLFVPVDVSDLVEKKNALTPEIDAYKADLLKEIQLKQATERIGELQDQESSLAQAIAEYEQEEFAIASFIKAKMEFVENKVNCMFSYVKYRMFRKQINGGEDPCCDCLVNGVEFEKNLNTAAKINAGLDVINTLSEHFGYSVPVFLDNRESVTDIIPTVAQVINLIVSPADTQIRVEHAGTLAAAL